MFTIAGQQVQTSGSFDLDTGGGGLDCARFNELVRLGEQARLGERTADSMPEVTYFLIKYLSFFVVGIVSGIWIWSNKTVRSWGNFCYRICCCCRIGSQNTGAAV